MNRIASFASGLVFGLGLILAGMADPSKVLAFLDLAGRWDPSLAFVMGGGVLVGLVAFAVARKRTTSLLGTAMQLPTSRDIDRRLVGGSLGFGVGWGLAGICPGPAIVLLGSGAAQGLLFVVTMLIGMGLFEVFEHRRRSSAASIATE
ncbi:DUF6691 family protein [Methylibium sp.]|uniref:DUF6691 family protein n=1 Tax=Methylibium sp. TaxID=2067992 RepID=UPI00286C1887|nr:DUF6691 family protein [Methylibium sp.]